MSTDRRPPEKGYLWRIRDGAVDGKFDFQFNPTTTKQSVNPQYSWIDPSGSPVPTAVFKSMGSDVFSLRLLLDSVENFSSEKQGVLAQRAFLESLVRPDLNQYLEGLGQHVAPPEVVFGFGPEAVDVVATGYACEVIRRNRNAVPTRAWVDMTFKTMFVDFFAVNNHYELLRDLRDLSEIK